MASTEAMRLFVKILEVSRKINCYKRDHATYFEYLHTVAAWINRKKIQAGTQEFQIS